MCKVGDIILVENFKVKGKSIKQHSFVVISDEKGKVESLDYDFVCNIMSSYKSEEQKRRKLAFPGNFPIANDDTITNPDNGKNGFLKTDQLFYFNKEKVDYKGIGKVKDDVMEMIMEFINESTFDITEITENL